MEKDHKQLWPLWGAMLLGQFLISTILAFSGTGELMEPAIIYGLPLMAIPEFMMGLFLHKLFGKTPASSAFIIRWACFTAASIMGGISAFMGGSVLIPIAMLVLTTTGMILTRPTAEAYTAWEMARLSDDE